MAFQVSKYFQATRHQRTIYLAANSDLLFFFYLLTGIFPEHIWPPFTALAH